VCVCFLVCCLFVFVFVCPSKTTNKCTNRLRINETSNQHCANQKQNTIYYLLGASSACLFVCVLAFVFVCLLAFFVFVLVCVLVVFVCLCLCLSARLNKQTNALTGYRSMKRRATNHCASQKQNTTIILFIIIIIYRVSCLPVFCLCVCLFVCLCVHACSRLFAGAFFAYTSLLD